MCRYCAFSVKTKHPVLNRSISNPQSPFSTPEFLSPGRDRLWRAVPEVLSALPAWSPAQARRDHVQLGQSLLTSSPQITPIFHVCRGAPLANLAATIIAAGHDLNPEYSVHVARRGFTTFIQTAPSLASRAHPPSTPINSPTLRCSFSRCSHRPSYSSR